ncbi:MAG: hypothetical protein BWY86_00541 [Candidatus Aminicenantes bacterium ADurb.Bin508]|nr:MAG: hypothetical protein BWY86_00541 [Candidatus Aminicenantes bacterium ADurb.Bin508]
MESLSRERPLTSRRGSETTYCETPEDLGKTRMGGYGSTRWSWHAKADTVEDSLVLEITELTRKKYIRPDSWTAGGIRWTNSRTGEETASIGFNADTVSGRFHLSYRHRGTPVDYSLRLESSPCRFGGVRWWWRCACGRRIVKAYLPPGSSRFGCRTCHRLTYESAQTHDKTADAFRRNPRP